MDPVPEIYGMAVRADGAQWSEFADPLRIQSPNQQASEAQQVCGESDRIAGAFKLF